MAAAEIHDEMDSMHDRIAGNLKSISKDMSKVMRNITSLISKREKLKFIGYFNDFSDTPAKDPLYAVNCIICNNPMTESDVRTVSLCALSGAGVSFFYRMHRTCSDSLSAIDQELYDNAIIELVEDNESKLLNP